MGKSNPRITRIFIFFRVPAIGISNAMTGTAHCSAQQHTAAHKRRAAHSAQHTAANSSAEQHGKLRVARPVQANYLLCKPGSLISHGADVFSAHSSAQQRTAAHSSAQQRTAASTAIVELRLNLLMSYNVKNKTISTLWDTILGHNRDPFDP